MNMPRMIRREETKIRPYSTFEVSTKDQIYQKMAKYGCYSSGVRRGCEFSGYVPYGGNIRDEVVYVFTAEKVRAKWDHKTTKKPHRMIGGKPHRVMNSTKIRSAHWKVRVYKFERNQVVSVRQGLRTFDAVLK